MDRQSLFIALGAISAPIVGVIAFLGPVILRDQRTRAVLATGVPAIAQVITSMDTGSRSNHLPVVNVTVLVHPGEPSAYEAKFTTLVSPLNGAMFAPGRKLAMKIDPKRPDRIALVGFAP